MNTESKHCRQKAIRDEQLKLEIYQQIVLIYRRRLRDIYANKREGQPRNLFERSDTDGKSSYSLQAPNLVSITRPDVSYDLHIKKPSMVQKSRKTKYFGHVFVYRCFIISRD
ncbi:hypothetical protein NC651_007520 [Populus alba x Populus x berolinensis]|nr:hypothetical protein NC651_007520 [Populus alba x Populus x berolinensis]